MRLSPTAHLQAKPGTLVRAYLRGGAFEAAISASPDSTGSRTTSQPSFAWASALCIAVVAVLSAASLTADFVWDDNQLIAHNPALGAPLIEVAKEPFFPAEQGGLAPPYYRPIPKLAFALTYRAFGLHAWAFHLLGYLLNLLCVALAFAWLRRRYARSLALVDPARATLLLAIAVLATALHPSRPQAVTWIAGSCELWLALFAMLAAMAWERRASSPFSGVLTCAACAAAYLSKEPAVILPLLLLGDSWLRDERIRARDALWPFAGTAVAHALRLAAIETPWSHSLAAGPLALLERVAVSLGYALSATIAPWNPRFQLNLPVGTGGPITHDATLLAALGVACGLLLVALAVLGSRAPSLRPWLADALWYFVPLLPVLNLLPIGVGMTVSERYLYLPLLGASALLLRTLLCAGRLQVAAAMSALVWIALCARVHQSEIAHLQSELALREHFFEQDPRELETVDALLELRLRNGDFLGLYALAQHRLQLVIDDRETPAQHATAQANRIFALVKHVRLELLLLSDLEQARLAELRIFYDELSDPERSEATLRVGNRDFRVTVDASARAALEQPMVASELRESRVMLHARTLDLTAAEQFAHAFAASEPSSTRARMLLMRALVWNQRWDDARAELDRAEHSGLPGPWRDMTHRLEAVPGAGSIAPAGPSLALARSMADWGLPALAYEWLDALPEHAPRDVERVLSRIHVLLRDLRFDLARRALAVALEAAPGLRSALANAAAEIAATEARAPLRRVGLPALDAREPLAKAPH